MALKRVAGIERDDTAPTLPSSPHVPARTLVHVNWGLLVLNGVKTRCRIHADTLLEPRRIFAHLGRLLRQTGSVIHAEQRRCAKEWGVDGSVWWASFIWGPRLPVSLTSNNLATDSYGLVIVMNQSEYIGCEPSSSSVLVHSFVNRVQL